jgi:hypothetical protein
MKQHALESDFSAPATTEQDYSAVASNKGDARLLERLALEP